MARWITVRSPFDYYWPGRSAVTAYREPGDYMVKDEVADFAISRDYATEGKAKGSSRSKKGKRAATDDRSATGVDHADPAGADRPADGPAVDHNAG